MTPAQARQHAGHTQRQAGEKIYVAERTWQDYERGERKMPPGLLQLYLLKTGQMTLEEANSVQSPAKRG